MTSAGLSPHGDDPVAHRRGADLLATCNTRCRGLVEALEQTPQQPLNRLPVLPDDERRQLLFGLNATDVDYDLRADASRAVRGAGAAHASRLPAVVAGEQSLSYAELNERANHLARHLRGLRRAGRIRGWRSASSAGWKW